MYVCMYVYTYLLIYVFMYLFLSLFILFIHLFIYLFISVCVLACMYIHMPRGFASAEGFEDFLGSAPLGAAEPEPRTASKDRSGRPRKEGLGVQGLGLGV